MGSKTPLLISFLIILCTILLLWYFNPSKLSDAPAAGISKPATTNITGQQAVIGNAAIGGPFTLVDQHGNNVTDEALKEQFALIYFGFTYCPDICPTALLTMTQAIEGLGTLGDRVLPVFITVDPQRDTPEVMKSYASNFHPRFLALTGTLEQTDAAAKAYKIFYKLHNEEDKENYVVDHTGYIYLMAPDGNYLTHFSHDDSAEAMMAILTKYIR